MQHSVKIHTPCAQLGLDAQEGMYNILSHGPSGPNLKRRYSSRHSQMLHSCDMWELGSGWREKLPVPTASPDCTTPLNPPTVEADLDFLSRLR